MDFEVNWLYFHSSNSEPLLHDVVVNTFNDHPEINIAPQNLDVDVDTILMATGSVDPDAEALHLAREELFSYLQLIRNNPPTTLSKMNQLVGLVNKMLDEANNLHIMDFDFRLELDALDSSLKRKKSFLSPRKKQRRREQNRAVQQSATMGTNQGQTEIQGHPTFPAMSDTGDSASDLPPSQHAWLIDNCPMGDLQEQREEHHLRPREIPHG